MQFKLFIFFIASSLNGFPLTNKLAYPIMYHIDCATNNETETVILPTTLNSKRTDKLDLCKFKNCSSPSSIIELFVYKSLVEYNQNKYIKINIYGDHFYSIIKARNSFGFMIKGVEYKGPHGSE